MNKIIVLLGLLVSTVSFADKAVPTSPDRYVLDEPSVLSQGAKEQLYQTLSKLDKTDGRQVVVAVFDSLDGEDVESYSNKVFHQWKVGEKGKNNGVLLAIYWKEHKTRIEVGYGLESVLTDAKSRGILESIKPKLRAKDNDGAVITAVNAIIQTTTKPVAEKTNPAPAATLDHSNDIVVAGVCVLLILLGILFMVLRSIREAKQQKILDEEVARAQEARRKQREEDKKLLAQNMDRLKKLYPNLTYEEALNQEAVEAEKRAAQERREEAERERKAQEQYLSKKWKVGIAGMTLAMAVAKEAHEQSVLRAQREQEEAIERERQAEESRKRRQREEAEESSRSSYSSSSSSDSDSSSGGGFSGGGGDSGGGGATGDW
jgi:uncharacterized protein